ncbi:MAG TPA: hypothetical protein PK545_07720, partial [Deltaproteobacteria bacterium]|nr:hypothetical protein [Deltaproteobacteria bacterium]
MQRVRDVPDNHHASCTLFKGASTSPFLSAGIAVRRYKNRNPEAAGKRVQVFLARKMKPCAGKSGIIENRRGVWITICRCTDRLP